MSVEHFSESLHRHQGSLEREILRASCEVLSTAHPHSLSFPRYVVLLQERGMEGEREAAMTGAGAAGSSRAEA